MQLLIYPRVILLDLHLGLDDGWDILPWLRNLDPQSAIIIHTGVVFAALEQRAAQAGVAILTKDLDRGRLLAAVARALESEESARSD